MTAPTTENGDNPPRRTKKHFRNIFILFVLFVLFGFPLLWLIYAFLVLGPGFLRNSVEVEGTQFFYDVESSLREKYDGTVMILNKWLGSDFRFRINILTIGEDAPSPEEIAEEICRRKKQSEFMSKEVLIVTINGGREDHHGGHFAFPGRKGYEGTHKPMIYLPDYIGGNRDF